MLTISTGLYGGRRRARLRRRDMSNHRSKRVTVRERCEDTTLGDEEKGHRTMQAAGGLQTLEGQGNEFP